MVIYKLGCLSDSGEVEPLGILQVDYSPELSGVTPLSLAEDFCISLMNGGDGSDTVNVTGMIREDVDKFFGLVWFLTNEQGQPLAFLADIDKPGSDMPPCGHERMDA